MAIDTTVKHNFSFCINYLKMLLDGVEADKITQQPFAGANHPAWIIGHITISMEFAASLAGVEYKAPEGYEELFGMKSKPDSEPGKYPGLAALLAELDKSVESVTPGLESVTAEQLAAEMPNEGFRDLMPTVGDGLTFVLNGHITTHIGQLSAWRRANGMPHVM